jgi:hypothetical protein
MKRGGNFSKQCRAGTCSNTVGGSGFQNRQTVLTQVPVLHRLLKLPPCVIARLPARAVRPIGTVHLIRIVKLQSNLTITERCPVPIELKQLQQLLPLLLPLLLLLLILLLPLLLLLLAAAAAAAAACRHRCPNIGKVTE